MSTDTNKIFTSQFVYALPPPILLEIIYIIDGPEASSKPSVVKNKILSMRIENGRKYNLFDV